MEHNQRARAEVGDKAVCVCMPTLGGDCDRVNVSSDRAASVDCELVDIHFINLTYDDDVNVVGHGTRFSKRARGPRAEDRHELGVLYIRKNFVNDRLRPICGCHNLT